MADNGIKLEEEIYEVSGSMTPEAAYCQDLFVEYESSSYRKRVFEEIEKGRKAYDSDRPATKNFPWENSSNKSMGLTAIAVDKLEPRMYNKLIAEDDFIQAEPTCIDDVGKIDDVKEFMNWAANNNMMLPQKTKPIVHDLLVDGTKYVITYWFEEDITIRIRGEQPVFVNQEGQEVEVPAELLSSGDPQQVVAMLMQNGITPGGSKQGVKEEKRTDFRVVVEGLKLEDTYWPDTNDDWDKQPFFRKIFPKLGDLVKGQENKVYKNITDALVKGVRRDTTIDEDRRDIQYSEYGQETELLECYLIWNNEWRIMTFSMLNNWEEVRNQKMSEVFWHGHKPVRRLRVYPKSTEQLGVGIPHKIRHYSTGINDLYNSMIDNTTIEVIPFGFYNQGSTGVMANMKLPMIPGVLSPIPKGSSVTFPNISPKGSVFIQFINLLMTFFERTLSIMDYSAGTRSSTVGSGGDTASGMNMILQEGNIAHNYTGASVQEDFADILTDALSLYAQYMPIDAKMRLFPENEWLFKPVSVESIQGKWDIKIEVSDASSNSMTNRNDAMQLAQITAGAPFVDQIQNVTDLYKAFGKKDTNKYIKPEFAQLSQALAAEPELVQPLMQFVQQFMQQKQQADRDQQIAGEAQANIRRQDIQRDIDEPLENEKILEQANENYKRGIAKDIIEGIGGIRETIQPTGGQGQ